MHHTLEITTPTAHTDALLEELKRLDTVIGLSVNRGSSIKPPGDVIVVHTLNVGTDDVLKRVRMVQDEGDISIVTAELASIIAPQHDHAVENDVDEAIWEEMETGLRHQGRVTPNYLALMALGGAIAATGLVSAPAPQAIAFVSASVIAPGFEPVAKIPLGLVLGKRSVVKRGLISSLAGYAVLIASAAFMFWILRVTGSSSVAEFVNNPEVSRISHPKLLDILVSACAACAGFVMIAAYRRSVIAGPLMALVITHSAAMIGVSFVAGRPALAWQAGERLGIDLLLIGVIGAIVVAIKQILVHRRKPLV